MADRMVRAHQRLDDGTADGNIENILRPSRSIHLTSVGKGVSICRAGSTLTASGRTPMARRRGS